MEINLFEEFTKEIDINNPNFKEGKKIEDWRGYVPFDWQKKWDSLTQREKQIVVVMAKMQDDNKEL